MRTAVGLLAALWPLGALILGQAGPSTPPPVVASDLVVRLDPAGRMPTHGNPTSPVAAGAALLLVDQAGAIYAWDGAVSRTLLTASTRPAGMRWVGSEPVLAVATNAEGSTAYVMFIAAEAPKDIPRRASPRPGADAWEVLYRYDLTAAGLSNARPVTALEVRSDGHTGGGMVVLADGSLLVATGDNGDAFEDGRQFADDPSTHLSKILHIDPTTGAVRVAARGVRNPQRLAVYPQSDGARLDFIDMGGFVAEELNSIPLARLLDGGAPQRFGWGRSASDHATREGTLFIDPGGRATTAPAHLDTDALPPVAQFGREGATLFAGSGPVSSTTSFARITSLFGDLVSGSVFAITSPLSTPGQGVFRVGLVDAESRPVTLRGLAGGEKPSPRFFNFPDGAAGVLVEPTGAFYRLTELSGQAPRPGERAARADAAAPGSPRRAVARFTAAPIAVDGVLDEPAWAAAETLADFRFPWGDAARGEASTAKVLWDADALYVGLRMTDAHIAAAGTSVSAIYDDDMFEVHLAPDIATPQVFFVFESNLNRVVSAQIRMANADGTNDWYVAWDTSAVRQAITMTRPTTDTAGAWVAELRIPFTALDATAARGKLPGRWRAAVPPVDGTAWHVNVLRANRDAPASAQSDYSLWSFNGNYGYGPGKDNMHVHDHNNFGILTFTTRSSPDER